MNAMAYKLEQTLWSVCITDGDAKFEWEEWIIRTIRKPFIYATIKNRFTWGKRSTKNGDFGWLDPVNKLWRTRWAIDGEPSKYLGIATTKRRALQLAIASQKEFGSDDDYDAGAGSNAAIIKRLETMLKRL